MKNFERAYKKLRDAKIQLARASEIDFPLESTVFYDHGYHERRGRVTAYSDDRLQIITPSQTIIWIDAYRIKRVSA